MSDEMEMEPEEQWSTGAVRRLLPEGERRESAVMAREGVEQLTYVLMTNRVGGLLAVNSLHDGQHVALIRAGIHNSNQIQEVLRATLGHWPPDDDPDFAIFLMTEQRTCPRCGGTGVE